MQNDSFICSCISEAVDGLRDGLSHFSPPSRAALVYVAAPGDPVRVHDPWNLLRGHEPRLVELFEEERKWEAMAPSFPEIRYVDHLAMSQDDLHLAGLISYSCWTKHLFFQAWFTEEHVDMCTIGPTVCWLEYAARLLARNVGSEQSFHLGTSGYVLQEYATHAVRDYIVDLRNMRIGWDTRLRIFPTLDAILGISKTPEEGSWPHGRLALVEPAGAGGMQYILRFPEMERPILRNFKHVRKLLLSVEQSERVLVSDGRVVIGIATGAMPPGSLIVDYHGDHGYLQLDDDLICTFADGRFHSSSRRANLVHVEEVLLEMDMDTVDRDDVFRAISSIVASAGRREHGCTLVIDPNRSPIEISGHTLENPLDLRRERMLDLAMSLAKVDGALHIGTDMRLHGFACLLDGRALRGENRARGARFNSALRFTAEHPDLIVVVVSADRPVSVIQGGVELTAQCEWIPQALRTVLSPTLKEWVRAAGD